MRVFFVFSWWELWPFSHQLLWIAYSLVRKWTPASFPPQDLSSTEKGVTEYQDRYLIFHECVKSILVSSLFWWNFQKCMLHCDLTMEWVFTHFETYDLSRALRWVEGSHWPHGGSICCPAVLCLRHRNKNQVAWAWGPRRHLCDYIKELKARWAPEIVSGHTLIWL